MVARETPAIRAVATMLLPWVRSSRAVACYSFVIAGGRLMFYPAARAASSSGCLRPLMRVRSYSANTHASW